MSNTGKNVRSRRKKSDVSDTVANGASGKSSGGGDDDDFSVDSSGNIRNLIDYDQDDTEIEETQPKRPLRKAALKARKIIHDSTLGRVAQSSDSSNETDTETDAEEVKVQELMQEEYESESESDSEVSETSTEDMETEDTDDDDSEDETTGIQLILPMRGMAVARKAAKLRKERLETEPEEIQKFVKLLEDDAEEKDELDGDINYFKSLTPTDQQFLIHQLEKKPSHTGQVAGEVPLKFQIFMKNAAHDVQRQALAKYTNLCNMDSSSSEYFKCQNWIHGYIRLPLGVYKDLPVTIDDGAEACAKFVSSVREKMDAAIYGHDEAKLQILQFVSSWIANPNAAGNVLSIHGPAGCGKTTLVKEGVAKALGRPFHFISLGGATDASYLNGHGYTYEGSVWGRIADVLMQSKCMNPIIYFDELDKISTTPHGEEISNMLIHLTDGSQNDSFQDRYFAGINLDLSRCLFIFSHNNHENVNPILRDRMYNIKVSGFDTKQKVHIAEHYLVPEALLQVKLQDQITFPNDTLKYIVDTVCGEEKGVRDLKRGIQTMVSKLNMLRFYNDPLHVPFAIKNFKLPVIVGKEHVDKFLKRKEDFDASIAHLYV